MQNKITNNLFTSRFMLLMSPQYPCHRLSAPPQSSHLVSGVSLTLDAVIICANSTFYNDPNKSYTVIMMPGCRCRSRHNLVIIPAPEFGHGSGLRDPNVLILVTVSVCTGCCITRAHGDTSQKFARTPDLLCSGNGTLTTFQHSSKSF